MESRGFERLSTAGRMAAGLVGLMALAASASAWAAGTETASLGVALRITESCQVDSAAVVGATRLARMPLPEVRCGFGAPRSIRVTREPVVEPLSANPSVQAPGDDATVVVTLTF